MAEESGDSFYNPANYFLILIVVIVFALAILWWRDKNKNVETAKGASEENVVEMKHEAESV